MTLLLPCNLLRHIAEHILLSTYWCLISYCFRYMKQCCRINLSNQALVRRYLNLHSGAHCPVTLLRIISCVVGARSSAGTVPALHFINGIDKMPDFH